jgi:hypothetical protein
VVSPDVGGVVRARALAKQLGCDLAIIDKRRPKANVSEVMHVIGEIDGRNCVIMDDMIDTAGTLVKAAEVLKDRGAKNVYAYCTHPIFSGPAIERITKGSRPRRSGRHQHHPAVGRGARLQQDPPAVGGPLIAETIQRIAKGESVMSCSRTRSTCSEAHPEGSGPFRGRPGGILKPEAHWSRWLPIGVSYEIRRFRAHKAGYGCEPPSPQRRARRLASSTVARASRN